MDKEKALGLFRLRLNGALENFNMYGLGIYIPQAIKEIERLALELHDNLLGKDDTRRP